MSQHCCGSLLVLSIINTRIELFLQICHQLSKISGKFADTFINLLRTASLSNINNRIFRRFMFSKISSEFVFVSSGKRSPLLYCGKKTSVCLVLVPIVFLDVLNLVLSESARLNFNLLSFLWYL